MKDSFKELPDELNEKCVTSFSEFVQKYDQGDTIKKLESSLPEWSNQIKLKRQELKELRKQNGHSKKVSKSTKSKK